MFDAPPKVVRICWKRMLPDESNLSTIAQGLQKLVDVSWPAITNPPSDVDRIVPAVCAALAHVAYSF